MIVNQLINTQIFKIYSFLQWKTKHIKVKKGFFSEFRITITEQTHRYRKVDEHVNMNVVFKLVFLEFSSFLPSIDYANLITKSIQNFSF